MAPLDTAHAASAPWVLNSAYLVLLMQPGFALLTCGLVRKKNAAHLVMLSFSAYVFALAAYYAVGYAFQFGAVIGILRAGAPVADRFLVGRGQWGFVGGNGFLLTGAASDAGGGALAMFEVALMLVAAYVIVGAICERIAFWSFVLCELFVGGLLYPVFGCWVWGGGWLSQLGSTLRLGHGYVDFAGSSVIHAVGGFCAMALAMILGPRLGKYGPDGRPRPFPAHNIVFVVVGTFVLLVGWMGLNSGSTLGAPGLNATAIALNTNLAAATAAASAMLFWYFAFGKPDISMACNGMLAGLVAISASCAFVGPNAAALIGILAGLLACGGVLFNEKILRIDDPCGSISVHGYCGWFGAVSVGIFADGSSGAGWNGVAGGITGFLHGDVRQFGVQLGGATLCALYAFGATYLVFKIVDSLRPIRVDPDVELEGLDLPEFGMLAYPEDEG